MKTIYLIQENYHHAEDTGPKIDSTNMEGFGYFTDKAEAQAEADELNAVERAKIAATNALAAQEYARQLTEKSRRDITIEAMRKAGIPDDSIEALPMPTLPKTRIFEQQPYFYDYTIIAIEHNNDITP